MSEDFDWQGIDEREGPSETGAQLRALLSDPRGAMRKGLTSMFEAMHENQVAVVAVGEAAGGSPRVYLEWRTRLLDDFIDKSAWNFFVFVFTRQEGRGEGYRPHNAAQRSNPTYRTEQYVTRMACFT